MRTINLRITIKSIFRIVYLQRKGQNRAVGDNFMPIDDDVETVRRPSPFSGSEGGRPQPLYNDNEVTLLKAAAFNPTIIRYKLLAIRGSQ